MDFFTIIACAIIIVSFGASWTFIEKNSKRELHANKRWIEQLPSLISSLGVLGTFAGITKGLLSFDTTNLDDSIPLLLNGLKTAFFTSLLGMAGSLILSRIVFRKFKSEAIESDVEKSTNIIIDKLEANHENLINSIAKEDTIKAIATDIVQIKDDIEEIKGFVTDLKEQTENTTESLDNIKSNTDHAVKELGRIDAVAVTATASISTIDNNIDRVVQNINAIKNKIVEDSEEDDYE